MGQKKIEIYIPSIGGNTPELLTRKQFTYHSWLLNIPATFGLIGLFFNLILIFSITSKLLRYRHKPQIAQILIILFIVLLHGIIEPIFESGFLNLNLTSVMFWITVGIGLRHSSLDTLSEAHMFHNVPVKS